MTATPKKSYTGRKVGWAMVSIFIGSMIVSGVNWWWNQPTVEVKMATTEAAKTGQGTTTPATSPAPTAPVSASTYSSIRDIPQPPPQPELPILTVPEMATTDGPITISVDETLTTANRIGADMPCDHNLQWRIDKADEDKVVWKVEMRNTSKCMHKMQIFALKEGVTQEVSLHYDIFPCSDEAPCYPPKTR